MPKSWDDVKPKKKLVNPNARRPPQNGDEQFVVDMMDHVLQHVENEPARHEWRVSSFPICGLLHLLKQIKDEPRPKPYSMDFFTSVGTAVHETIQYHLTNAPKTGGLMVGNFECKRCGWKTETPEGQRRPRVCGNCQNEKLHYIEIDFAAHGISGHLDGLIETQTRRIALEFKTTSGPNVEDPTKWLPYSKHFFQIETYCFLLGYLYRKPPTHYTIIYVNRDGSFQPNPSGTRIPYYSFTYKITPEMMNRRRQEFGRTFKAREVVNHILKNPTRGALSALSDLRPCKSEEDYVKNMKPAFFGDDQCPYAKSGDCWKSKQLGLIKPASDAWSLLQNPGAIADLTIEIPMTYIDEIED